MNAYQYFKLVPGNDGGVEEGEGRSEPERLVGQVLKQRGRERSVGTCSCRVCS